LLRSDVVGILYQCEAAPSVVVHILSNPSHVGDNITVQCRIDGVADLRPRVRWLKSVVGDDVEQTIADKETLVRPYSTHNRYTISLTAFPSITIYLLTIYCELILFIWKIRSFTVDYNKTPENKQVQYEILFVSAYLLTYFRTTITTTATTPLLCRLLLLLLLLLLSGVTRRVGEGRTPSMGVTPEGKEIVWANLQRIVEKRRRTGKKVWGDTLEGGDTRVKAIKSDKVMSKKRSVSFCEEEIRGDTAELATKKVASARFSGKPVAAPGVTHPSDATATTTQINQSINVSSFPTCQSHTLVQ